MFLLHVFLGVTFNSAARAQVFRVNTEIIARQVEHSSTGVAKMTGSCKLVGVVAKAYVANITINFLEAIAAPETFVFW